jgi:hypothetical protein
MKVQPFDRYGSPSEIATRHFGGVRGMKDAVSRLQTASIPITRTHSRMKSATTSNRVKKDPRTAQSQSRRSPPATTCRR